MYDCCVLYCSRYCRMVAAGLLLAVVQLCVHLWDLLSYPVYLLLQRPWSQTSRIHRYYRPFSY